MISNICPKCGTINIQLNGIGPVYYITEIHIANIMDLFIQDLDKINCLNERCDNKFDIQPTIIFKYCNPTVIHITVGTLAKNKPNINEVLTKKAKEISADSYADIKYFETISDLRSFFVPSIKHKLPAISNIIQNDFKLVSEYIFKNWNSLTPDIFCLAWLCIIGAIPGIKIVVGSADGDISDEDELLDNLGTSQILVWITITYYIFGIIVNENTGIQSENIESFLRKFIDNSYVVRGTIDKYMSYVIDGKKAEENLKNEDDINPIFLYCVEAINASLYYELKESNTRTEKWVATFYKIEMLYLLTDNSFEKIKLDKALISTERAARTIPYKQAWNVVRGWISGVNKTTVNFDYLRKVSTKAGHPTLINDLLLEGIKVEFEENVTIEYIIENLENLLNNDLDFESTLAIASKWGADYLVEFKRIKDLELLANWLFSKSENTIKNKVLKNIWLCEYYKILRLPDEALKYIGELANVWEFELDNYLRVRLWTERSNALRLKGSYNKALQIIIDVINTLPEDITPADRRVALMNYAILLRETGNYDTSSNILLSILDELSVDIDFAEKIDIMHSLMVTYSLRGDYHKGLLIGEEALKYATGPYKKRRPIITYAYATLLIRLDRIEEAIEEIVKQPMPSTLPLTLLLAEINIWLMILGRKSFNSIAESRFNFSIELLFTIPAQAESTSDLPLLVNSLLVIASYLEICESPEAKQVWRDIFDLAQAENYPINPVVLANIAYYAYLENDIEFGRKHLIEIPGAMSIMLGASKDLNTVYNSTETLEYYLRRVVSVIINNKLDWEDVRLISEISRDAVGRAQILRHLYDHGEESTSLQLSDEDLAVLAQPFGDLAVVEWVSDKNNLSCFITQIDQSGRVRSRYLDSIEVSLKKVANVALNRLANWYSSKQSNPFDFKEWITVQDWIHKQLSSTLPYKSHIIFLEHVSHEGFPWHVVVSSQWSSSYISSWTALLALQKKRVNTITSIGVGFAPRFRESNEVLYSCRNSVRRTESFASENGFVFFSSEEQSFDFLSFKSLMEKSDIAKIICHGYIDSSNEINLMIAHNGALPLASSVFSGSEYGKLHRLSWSDCQNLDKTPEVVFSGACSSGVNRIVGLGDRLGLFSGLRQKGTKAIVAPRWAIEPVYVLPILDNTLELYIKGDYSLAQALHLSCTNAKECPYWLAWALAIEGDWR